MKSNVICPNLKGDADEATCTVVTKFIRDMEDAGIRLCMNRRYEACPIYANFLIKTAMKLFISGATIETGQ